MVLAALAALLFAPEAAAKKSSKVHKPKQERTEKGTAVLWRNPGDIRSRNLFYGPGGEEHAPNSLYTFEKEDMDGTSPKFTVRDGNGVRWKVKMGAEARPETVASRLPNGSSPGLRATRRCSGTPRTRSRRCWPRSGNFLG